MSDRVVELFERFLEERAAGARPDAAAFVHEAGAEAEALAGMITAYLATHPENDVVAEDVLALAARPELAPAPSPAPWSELLPALRARSSTTRGQLVARLTALLGVAGAEPQVGGYVHELEVGLLSPRGVRPAVVTALAEILAVRRALLERSRLMGVSSEPIGSAAFARLAAAPDASVRMFRIEPPRDPRVDDLFTGGGDG